MITRESIASTEHFKGLPKEEQEKLLATAEEIEQHQQRVRSRGGRRFRMTCRECGQEDMRGNTTVRLCRKCQGQRARENRRDRRRERRRTASPLYKIKRTKLFQMLVPKPIKCKYCGEKFEAKRTTAKYCSANCRVYANRAKAKVP